MVAGGIIFSTRRHWWNTSRNHEMVKHYFETNQKLDERERMCKQYK